MGARLLRAHGLLALALLAAVSAACGRAEAPGQPAPPAQPVEGVGLSTDRDRYRAGDRVKVILENRSGKRVGYNLCFTNFDLEHRDRTTWTKVWADLAPPQPAPGGATWACTTELRLMGSPGKADGGAHIPADLTPGAYRLAYDVEVGGERRRIATATFTVER